MGRCLLILLAGALSCLGETDFTGKWRLNPEKSFFGDVPKPAIVVTTIRQTNNEIAALSQAGGNASEYRWSLDGKECTNVVAGSEIRTVASWRGPLLHVKSKTSLRGNSLLMTDQYSLSDDGATLIIFRTILGPKGEFEHRYVYDRQTAE